MIVFRADASTEIGTGHIMRCLTLADALSARGEHCEFICRDLPGNLNEFIKERGYKVHLLPKPSSKLSGDIELYQSWLGVQIEQEIHESREILDRLAPAQVVLDHYALDKAWQEQTLPAETNLVVIDDLANRKHGCDLLVDQNLGRNAGDYKGLLKDKCRLLLGPEFALLRPEFQKARSASLERRKHGKFEHLLITMGGVDKDNSAEEILKLLSDHLPEIGFHITLVMGARSPWMEGVRRQAADMSCPVEIRFNVNDMAKLMANADLAIGAAGSTSWERCCLGLPTLLLITAENQEASGKAQADVGSSALLGKLWEGSWKENLLGQLSLLSVGEDLQAMSNLSAEICDGKGTSRVVDEILMQRLTLKPATREDSGNIWNWRYSSGAEKFYKNPHRPQFKEHDPWYENALNNPDLRLFILMKDNRPIGHLRADFQDDSHTRAEVSIYLSATAAGKGLGRLALGMLEQEPALQETDRFEAMVHHKNYPSLKLFLAAGYIRDGISGDFVTFTRQIGCA